ncbi:MAG: TylF/MycF/NovP-related O-methyltransferase [Acidobacteriota bacterium]
MRPLEERYLHLLRIALTREFPEPVFAEIPRNTRTALKAARFAAYSAIQRVLRPFSLSLVQTNRYAGETMMGMGALTNLHDCMRAVTEDGVPGDFVETGVWRGGGTIYMRGFLEACGDRQRHVWVCDSFEGLPKPKDEYAADRGSQLWASEYLAVSVEQVRHNFEFYGLLDDRVHFLKGFFSDTMPTAPVSQIAVLRLDGDMYESTIVVLEHLYPKISSGGYVIIDDFGMLPECNQAVEDYRARHSVVEPLQIIGYVRDAPLGAYWRKG